tara:strand:+ start:29 stop:202 length:174 start_codon:yes stop_codon:yes gene_type:complete
VGSNPTPATKLKVINMSNFKLREMFWRNAVMRYDKANFIDTLLFIIQDEYSGEIHEL